MQCAPVREEHVDDRALRTALHRARKTPAFATQQNFDKAVSALVQAIPIPKEIIEWVPTETFIAPARRNWKKYVQNPVFLATGIAALVIAVILVFQLIDRLNRFPGEPTARRLLTTAASTHSVILDPVKTTAGALGDYFFMKHRLAHYDVPAEFAELKTLGVRVFDDEEGQRVAQVWAVEKKMQFFLFPAERDPKSGATKHFRRLALRGSGSLDWCRGRARRRLLHGCAARKRKRSRALRFGEERMIVAALCELRRRS